MIADYSWARPTPAALKAAGYIGVIRYVGPGNRGRDVTRDEIHRLHLGGLGVGLVWETTTTAALAGWQAGYADVERANHYADRHGYPDHLPIFYAVDTDVSPAAIRGPVADTFRGAIRASKRPVRPYGECDVLDILCGELKLMDCGWQCMAWSRGRLSPYRCMYQLYPPRMDGQVDANEIGPMPLDFLWHPHIEYGHVAHEEDDMPYTETQLRDIAKGAVIEVMQDSVVGLAEAIAEVRAKQDAADQALLRIALTLARMGHEDAQAIAQLVAPGTTLPIPSVNP